MAIAYAIKNETLLCGSRGEPLGAELACALARCPPGTNGRMLGREDSCFVFEGLGEDLRMWALVRLLPPALESRDLDAAILFKAHMIETLHVREGFFFFTRRACRLLEWAQGWGRIAIYRYGLWDQYQNHCKFEKTCRE